MDPRSILMLRAIQNIVDCEPLFGDDEGNYLCAYCDIIIDEDGLHDEDCAWATLRKLWEDS